MYTVLKIIIGLLVAIILYLIIAPYFDKVDPGVSNPEQFKTEDSLMFVISRLEVENGVLSDSISLIRNEKEKKEQELKDSKTQIKKLISGYKEYKGKKDTFQVVVICDSMVDEIERNYIPLSEYVIKRANVIDSMQQIQIKLKDSMMFEYGIVQTAIKNDLQKERTKNEILTDKLNRKRKVPVFAAIGGFITGIFAVLLIQ